MIEWIKSSVANRWATVGSVTIHVTAVPFPGQTLWTITDDRGPGNKIEHARLAFDPSDEIVLAIVGASINANAERK